MKCAGPAGTFLIYYLHDQIQDCAGCVQGEVGRPVSLRILPFLLNSYIRNGQTLFSQDIFVYRHMVNHGRHYSVVGVKAFCISSPAVWNSLFDSCKHAELLSTFRNLLKTELFHVGYCQQQA